MGMESSPFKLILGSSSMARRQILTELGYEFTIITADIDEKDAIISRVNITGPLEEDTRPTLLITADTKEVLLICGPLLISSEVKSYLHLIGIEVVVYEGTIREKPSSKEEARQFIKGYSGGLATVVGSVVVTNLTTGNRKGGWDRSEVYFHDIPDEVIDSLVEEEIMLNVAGGLMLEHPLTMPLIDTVVGTADSVMGLSKALTEKLIQEAL
ncbi:hypothetical protein RJ640_011125 [Escallonia rubra]|uniref:Maf-like protein n=1 Tax=Escallonia rubra TaxID=112253 RepID=A0AA88S0W9_9ASTE|nr:hypothetical protein RJ640_011125 [Escallonia rubra]